MQSRAGWREKQDFELSGKDGKPAIQQTLLTAKWMDKDNENGPSMIEGRVTKEVEAESWAASRHPGPCSRPSNDR
jgi:hypothetical protein